MGQQPRVYGRGGAGRLRKSSVHNKPHQVLKGTTLKIYVPPYVPHQEINALKDEDLECVLVRSDGEAIAVNLPDVEPVEKPETVRWVDPTHQNLP